MSKAVLPPEWYDALLEASKAAMEFNDARARAVRRAIGFEEEQMGDVVQLRIEMTEAEFLAKWKEQGEEWDRIKDEWLHMHASGHWDAPVAADITNMQMRRARQEGRELLDFAHIWIVGKGWFVPRDFDGGPKAWSERKKGAY